MDKSQQKELKKQARNLKPMLVIGKEGISQNSIENIKKNLAANKLTKIKISKNYLDENKLVKKDVANHIAKQLGATLIDLVGFVAVYYKR